MCLLEKNLEENKSLLDSNTKCTVKELNWSNYEKIEEDFDKQRVIIIADCIYYEQVSSFSVG